MSTSQDSEVTIKMLKERIRQLEKEINDLETDALLPWGPCRRGCPPSYLDSEGYCSPACALGAPRGEFVTLLGPSSKEQLS
jgi:hypothetical protein